MVLEKPIIPFLEWLSPRPPEDMGALLWFLVIVAVLLVVSLFIGYLRMAIQLGPGEGFYAVAKSLATALAVDLPNTTFRRIWAMARLSIQESLRRRVLVAFAIFALVLLFAGWFLDTENDHPARLYLRFVLWATELLTLILAVLLSTFSLPNDVKSKTIYTVVTKPIRAGEIVFGRIVGFAAVNTAILVLMGVVSYVFVARGLSHTHTVDAQDVEQVKGTGGALQAWKGVTGREAYHRHDFALGHDQTHGQTDMVMDHYHDVRAVGQGEARTFEIGSPGGALVARVPRYGKLHFYDRAGKPGKGISVGKEWTYREYIEGGSEAAAAWTFSGIRLQDFLPSDFTTEELRVALTPRARRTEEQQTLARERGIDQRIVIPLELSLSVFRTYKGDIVSGITGALTVKNPTNGRSSEEILFTAKEFLVQRLDIPRGLKEFTGEGSPPDIDLFGDLVDEAGNVEIWIRCAEPGQYYGMAQPDLYIRGRDASFLWNFCKAYISIWLQMVIITCFGVVFSTFLSGPVAMFTTLITYVIGLFKEFIGNVASGVQVGGGPVESFIRILTQKNLTVELDLGPVLEWLVKAVDKVLMVVLRVVAEVFPDYSSFNVSQFVAYGYNIDGNLLSAHCAITLSFVLVLSVFGYFFLKSREIAA